MRCLEAQTDPAWCPSVSKVYLPLRDIDFFCARTWLIANYKLYFYVKMFIGVQTHYTTIGWEILLYWTNLWVFGTFPNLAANCEPNMTMQNVKICESTTTTYMNPPHENSHSEYWESTLISTLTTSAWRIHSHDMNLKMYVVASRFDE